MFLSASIWKSRDFFGAAALAVVIEVLTLVHLRIGLDFMVFSLLGAAFDADCFNILQSDSSPGAS